MNKKIRVLLLILILILLVLILRQTYSKYVNVAEAKIEERIGQWVIKVNDVDITNEPITEKILKKEDFIWTNTSRIVPNKIAPGERGYFDLVVDPTGTDVSFDYTITIDFSNFWFMETNIDTGETRGVGFEVSSIEELNGKTISTIVNREDGTVVATRLKSLSEIVSEDSTTKIDKIRIYVEWVNNEENNDLDSRFGNREGTSVELPITFNAIQHV